MMSPNKIPLELIRVASPCTASWDEMAGDDQARFCAQCSQHVYNLSDLTKEQAEALVLKHEGMMCVRYYQRPDGSVLTKDCPIGWRAIKRHSSIALGIAVAVFALICGFLTAGVLLDSKPRRHAAPLPMPLQMIRDWLYPPVITGDMCVPPVKVAPPQNAPIANDNDKK